MVYLDCGFGIFRSERIRLRGIDAPEINTLAGKRAKAFVEKELAKSEFVIVKSYWKDPFARYVGDIFFSPKEKDAHKVAEKGVYLNQLLLDEGMARAYD